MSIIFNFDKNWGSKIDRFDHPDRRREGYSYRIKSQFYPPLAVMHEMLLEMLGVNDYHPDLIV